MKKIKHSSLQITDDSTVSPLGVILSSLAECEGQNMTLYEKAIHIDNALAFFIKHGYSISFYSDDESLLLFKNPINK